MCLPSENGIIESEDKIIKALMRASLLSTKKQELSWTELVNHSGVSRRTLNLQLKRMEKNGLIKRRVDVSSGKYPPPVYYSLIQTDPKVTEILDQHKAYDRAIEKEITFEESPQEFIEKLETKVSPVLMYTILKSIASGSKQPLTDTIENLRFTLKKYLVYKQPFNESDFRAVFQKFNEVDQKPKLFKHEIDPLFSILAAKFPNETRTIDRVYAKPRKRHVARAPNADLRGRPKKLTSPEKETSK